MREKMPAVLNVTLGISRSGNAKFLKFVFGTGILASIIPQVQHNGGLSSSR